MVRVQTNAVEDRIRGSAAAGLPISAEDSRLLSDAIQRWKRFLLSLFAVTSTRGLDDDRLDSLSIEDTERYLDVRIRLTSCLGAGGDRELEAEFDRLLGNIRKCAYHFTTVVLPNLRENSRSLLLAAAHHESQREQNPEFTPEMVVPKELDDSNEYKDCLVTERRQLKSEIFRHQARLVHLMSELERTVENSFNVRG